MIIHEVGKYYNKDLYDVLSKTPDIINTINKLKTTKDPNQARVYINDLLGDEILNLRLTTKDKNSLKKLLQDNGINLNDYKSHTNTKKEFNDVIKSGDAKHLKNLQITYMNNARYDKDYVNLLLKADRLQTKVFGNRLDHNGKSRRYNEVMKQWEERKHRQQEQKDTKPKNKSFSTTKKIGIGAALGTGSYLVARKLTKLKGLENRYMRKLLLLPPNKRSFVQKMLDKIRALIRKYKH